MPDPNTFGGPLMMRGMLARATGVRVPLPTAKHPAAARHRARRHAVGHRAGRPHRASAELALHVLELMTSAMRSSDEGRRIDMATTFERAGPMRFDLAHQHFDLTPEDIMETLRYGLVGGGFITQFHLRALESVRGVEVAGLTLAHAPARAGRQRYVPATSARRGCSTSVREMAHHVDVIAIYNPNFSRIDTMEQIAAAVGDGAKLRGLICEKPLGRNVAEARRVAATRRARSACRRRTSRTRST